MNSFIKSITLNHKIESRSITIRDALLTESNRIILFFSVPKVLKVEYDPDKDEMKWFLSDNEFHLSEVNSDLQDEVKKIINECLIAFGCVEDNSQFPSYDYKWLLTEWRKVYDREYAMYHLNEVNYVDGVFNFVLGNRHYNDMVIIELNTKLREHQYTFRFEKTDEHKLGDGHYLANFINPFIEEMKTWVALIEDWLMNVVAF